MFCVSCSPFFSTLSSFLRRFIMGAEFIGHALPGVFILILALWWLLRLGSWKNTSPTKLGSFQHMASLVRIKSRTLPIPSIVIQLFVLTLILREMTVSGWKFYHDTYTHVTCYILFALPGLVEIASWAMSRCSARPSEAIPPFFLHLAYAICVGGIGVLFSFHLDGTGSDSVAFPFFLFL